MPVGTEMYSFIVPAALAQKKHQCVKYLAPVMPRTNLGELFKLLDAEEQDADRGVDNGCEPITEDSGLGIATNHYLVQADYESVPHSVDRLRRRSKRSESARILAG